MVQFRSFFLWGATVAFFFVPNSFAFPFIISEIDPTSEYIELQNISEENVSTENWTWSEHTSSGNEKTYTIESEAEIAPNEFFIIETSRKINDSGDTVSIYSPDQQQKDSVIIPVKQSEKTYQLINKEWRWETASKGESNIIDDLEEQEDAEEQNQDEDNSESNESNQEEEQAENENQDEGEGENEETENIDLENERENNEDNSEHNENTSEDNIPIANAHIVFSEIVPNPEGTDGNDNEFIEIYNFEETEINLSGWMIIDNSGKTYTFPQNTIISPQSFLAIYKHSSAITLNNSNETLVLLSPTAQQKDEIHFSGSAASGESYSRNIEKNTLEWTTVQTPNENNIFTKTDEERDEEIQEMEKTAQIFNPITGSENFGFLDDLEMKIIKFSPHAKTDFIEIQCINCKNDTNIYNIRLAIDDIAYTIPENIFIDSKTILRFEFSKTQYIPPLKTESGYTFFIPQSGLTSTDETIAVGTPMGKILDAVCYANQNGSLVSSEKKEIGQFILANAWQGELSESGCLSSNAIPRESLFIRTATTDTNTKEDFSRTRNENLESAIPSNISQLFFSTIVFANSQTQIEIENRSENFIDLNGWYIANHQKWMMDIAKENMKIAPHQKIILQLSSQQVQKYRQENMMIDIRNPSGEIHDVLCINLAKDDKGKTKAMKTLSLWKQHNFWKKDSGINQCLQYYAAQETHEYIRENFTHPASTSQYIQTITNVYTSPLRYTKEEQEKMKHEKLSIPDSNLITHEKMSTTEKSKEREENKDALDVLARMTEEREEREKREEKKNLSNFTAEITPKGLLFSGETIKGIKAIHVSIPSKNISFTVKPKKQAFEYLFEKPLKKGRYAIDIKLEYKDKTFEYMPRQRILLNTSSMPNELATLSFARVIPNPEGKDKGNEQVEIINDNTISGWMRNWTLELHTDTKISVKKLPARFIEKNSLINIPSAYFPSLRNSNATIVLKDSWGNNISQVSWEKARNNEQFGLHAETYIPKTKTSTKKTTKKKTSGNTKTTPKSTIKPFVFPKKEKVKGLILSRTNNFILIHTENGIFIKHEIPEYLEYSKEFFTENGSVNVFFAKGEVKDIVPFLEDNNTELMAIGGHSGDIIPQTIIMSQLLTGQSLLFLAVIGFIGMVVMGIVGRKMRLVETVTF